MLQGAAGCEAEATGWGFNILNSTGIPSRCFFETSVSTNSTVDISEEAGEVYFRRLIERCEQCVNQGPQELHECLTGEGTTCYEKVVSPHVLTLVQCHQMCPYNHSWACSITWDTPDDSALGAANSTNASEVLAQVLDQSNTFSNQNTSQPCKTDNSLDHGELASQDRMRLSETSEVHKVTKVRNQRALLSRRSGGSCWTPVVDAAICGVTSVVDGAVCGFKEAKDCSWGRRRRWSGFKGCSFWKIPGKCDTAAKCSMATDMSSCLGELVSSFKNEYKDYAELLTKSGCSSISSCKSKVEDGLDGAWDVVNDGIQDAKGGIGYVISHGLAKFGTMPQTLVSKTKQSAATLNEGLTSATSGLKEIIAGNFGSFQKYDLGDLCTASGVGFWYMEPTDCGFFDEFAKVFTNPLSAESHWNDAADKLATCVTKMGAFGFPTPFLDFKVAEYCMPQEVKLPVEYLLGAFKYSVNSGAALVAQVQTLVAKIEDLVKGAGINLQEIGRQVKQKRAAAKLQAVQARAQALTLSSLNSTRSSSSVWARCACEVNGHGTFPSCTSGTSCSCQGLVRFGYGDRWSALKSVSGSIQCSRSSFGGDPYGGQAKECQCLAAACSWELAGTGYCFQSPELEFKHRLGMWTDGSLDLAQSTCCGNDACAAVHYSSAEQDFMMLESLGSPSGDLDNECWKKKQCDWNCYLSRYADLRSAFGTDVAKAAQHFMNNGNAEGRDCSCEGLQCISSSDCSSLQMCMSSQCESCNWGCYLERYADLKAAFGDNYESAAAHWQNSGRNEGRDCHCSSSLSESAGYGIQVAVCFDYSFVAVGASVCLGLLFGEKAGSVVMPNLLLEVIFGASSFKKSELKNPVPQAGFSLSLAFAEEYPGFLPASEPRWGAGAYFQAELDFELEGLASVGVPLSIAFLPDPRSDRGWAVGLALSSSDGGGDAGAALAQEMQRASERIKHQGHQHLGLLAAISQMEGSSHFDKLLKQADLPNEDVLVRALSASPSQLQSSTVPAKLSAKVAAGVGFGFCLTPPTCQGQ